MALKIAHRPSLEELEIEKVLKRESSDGAKDEIDVLRDKFIQNQETQAAKEEEADDSNEVEDTSSDEDTTADNEAVADDNKSEEGTEDKAKEETVETDSDDGDKEPATESFYSKYSEINSDYLAMEQAFIDTSAAQLGLVNESIGDYVAGASRATGRFAVKHLITGDGDSDGYNGLLMRLSRLGISYGKLGLKKLAKGILRALNRGLELLIANTRKLARHIDKKNKSYTRFKGKIAKLNELISAIEASDVKEPDHDIYEDLNTIASLKVGTTLDIAAGINSLLALNSSFNGDIVKYTNVSIIGLKRITSEMMSGKSKVDVKKMVDELPISGFNKINADGSLTEYHFNKVLPGDHRFILQLPSNSSSEYEDVRQAYHAARSYMEIDSRLSFQVAKGARYLTLEECKKALNSLEKLCDTAMQLEEGFKKAAALRLSVKPSIKTYIDYLIKEQDHLTVRESLAEIVSLKMQFIDSVIFDGAIAVDDLNTGILSAALNYIKVSIARYTD